MFDSIVVHVAGEVDAHNVRPLADYLERHSAVTTRFNLDLREVTFFAASGLAMLRRVQHQVDASGGHWRLFASPAVRKLLRVCDAEDLLQFETPDWAITQRERAVIAAVGTGQ